MAAQQYTKDEMWKLYEKLPEELKEAVFSQENADYIFNACERYGVSEVSRVASSVGLVLMGLLLPRDLQGTLVKEVGLNTTTAQKVASDINRFVFYPVKPALEQLYAKIGEEKGGKEELGVPTPRHEETEGYIAEPETEAAPKPQGAQKKKPIFSEESEEKKQDTYRESIDL